jgi:hypothetical protein
MSSERVLDALQSDRYKLRQRKPRGIQTRDGYELGSQLNKLDAWLGLWRYVVFYFVLYADPIPIVMYCSSLQFFTAAAKQSAAHPDLRLAPQACISVGMFEISLASVTIAFYYKACCRALRDATDRV